MSHGQDLPREAAELVALARQWIPYGRVPPELIFQTFGITDEQFVDRLWAAVQDAHCAPHLVRAFSAVYPRRRALPVARPAGHLPVAVADHPNASYPHARSDR